MQKFYHLANWLTLLFTILFLKVDAQSSIHLQNREVVADTNLILPPSWAFGILYGGYTNQQETIDRIKEIKKHNYPIDAYWIDSWFWSYTEKGKGPQKYIDFVADTIAFPDRSKMWDFLQKNNIKGGFWTWDCILETGNEKAFTDFKAKGYFSNIYDETNTWHNNSFSTAMFQDTKDKKKATLCGNINFDDPQAVLYFKQQMKHFFDEGADFIKLDRTAKVGTSKTMFEISQEFGKETKGRGFMLAHSFDTDNEEYKRYPAKWTDDTRSDWTVEKPLVKFAEWAPAVAFKENIAMFTNPVKPSSKIPFLANDLGGYTVGNVSKPEEELYIRWLQFSMFNPIVEVFSEPENITSNLPWKYSERADSVFRFYAQLRMQLFPYIYSYALRSRIEGNHMIGKFPEHIYQYTFGDELLLVPVYERGAVTQKVYIPEGNWINYWTGEEMKGNEEYTVSAPVHEVPLFVKQGAIIPMRNYASSIEKGNNNTLTLHVYPGAEGSFNLLEDDGISNDYLNGIYASTIIELKNSTGKFVLTINPIQGNYSGMSPTRNWILYIHSSESPKQISLDRKSLKFRYNKVNKIAIVETSQLQVKKLLDFEVSY
jgi:alpha-glucosidase (family GH31 glycosyl hydrolase)